jgi:hypothetical protein
MTFRQQQRETMEFQPLASKASIAGRLNVSASIAGISADASNKISRAWFKYGGVEVTTVPQSSVYELHVSLMLTKAYLAARDPRWDPSPDYKWAVYGVCWAENRAVYKDGLSNDVVNITDLNVNDTYPGFSPMVMGTVNQSWTIYFIGNLAGTSAILTPAQLQAAFGS